MRAAQSCRPTTPHTTEFVVLLLLLLLCPMALSALPAAQVDALMRIYNETGGDYWGDCWLTWGYPANDPCSGFYAPANSGFGPVAGWVGWGECVLCNVAKTSVIAIVAPGNNMTGPLSSALCDLPDLHVLNFNGNSLEGSVPPCIRNLGHSLTYLDLSNNLLTGLISDWVCNLTLLTNLRLYENSLVGEVPNCIENLGATLTTLDLDTNFLNGSIPSGVCNLTVLTFLSFTRNLMTGTIPPCIDNLRSLATFALGDNYFSGVLPGQLCNLTALTYLALDDNVLEGEIPACIGDLGKTLTFLGLQDNPLIGRIPDGLCRLTLVTEIMLLNTNLEGEIPECIGNLNQSLESLDLRDTRISGAIPQSLCHLTALSYLNLNNVQLTPGPIPECLCRLSNLGFVDCSGTRRTGQLPPCLFGAQPPIYNFSAARNAITGALPRTLCNATSLMFLDLGYSSLSGPVPECIGQLKSLASLQLTGLALSGSLPQELFGLPGLEVLLLSHASLSGGLPPAINFSKNMTFTAYNDVIDTIVNASGPPLGKLKLLGLVRCGLSGYLPQWLGTSLPQLTTLALGGNRFSGPLPTFAPSSILEQLAAPNNELTGTFEPLQSTTLLTRLDLTGNRLTGRVPDWLAQRTSGMTEFAAETNMLSCDLPSTMTIQSGGTLRLLEGNVFGNKNLPSSVANLDPGAQSYSGGSERLTQAGLIFAAAVALALAVAAVIHARSSSVADIDRAPWRPQHLLGAAMIVVAFLLTVTLLPIYATADGLLACRYGWVMSAAYLTPFDASGGGGMWTVGSMLIGGFGVGGILVSVLVGGSRAKLVDVSMLRRNAVTARSTKTRPCCGGMSAAPLIMVAAVTMLLGVAVGVNVAFVLLQESPSLTTQSKTVLVVLFSLIHDLINHFVTPLVVTTVANRARSATPTLVATSAAALSLANSLVGPMVALLVVSTGCFKNKLFGHEPTTTATVNLATCQGTTLAANGSTVCEVLDLYPVNVSFVEEFRFSGERCLSAITTLYTPEFLVIFAVRLLLYFFAWWLADRGQPWILAGTRPARKLLGEFLAKRARLLSCFRRQKPLGEAELRTTVGAEALAVLHSTEPANQAFNLLSIAATFGVLSPVLAVAAAGVWLVLVVLGRVLGKPVGRGRTSAGDEVTPEFPLHGLCIGLLLVVHSLYVLVLLSVSGFAAGGIAIVAVNWAVFSIAWWWSGLTGDESRFDSEGTALDQNRLSSVKTATENPLFEKLLGDTPPSGTASEC